MTSPISPRLIRGGLVILNDQPRVIAFQYNPDTLTRSLQVQGIGAEGGDRSEALRLKAPPVETIKLDAEFDLTDELEGDNSAAKQFGLHPRLAALETIIYPPSDTIQLNKGLALAGTLEIAPAEMPLVLFIWSEQRILPVRLTEFNVTEEAFDTKLNPIRARVSLGMRVLTVHDLPTNHRGSDLYMAYQNQKEVLAGKLKPNSLTDLGVRRIP
ncbi:MAG: hypothetical protein GC204_16455 [Chloroflexi bacterium]|nr:hypothetical protein [Chloroflexota bacterium]